MAAIDGDLLIGFQNNNNNNNHHYLKATNINGPQQTVISSGDDSDPESPYSNIILELKGYLNKWTNYIHGWQARFIVFKDGTLSYYKSEEDSDFGCRGAISIHKATIKVCTIVFFFEKILGSYP